MYPTKETALWKPPPWNGECAEPVESQADLSMLSSCVCARFQSLLLLSPVQFSNHSGSDSSCGSTTEGQEEHSRRKERAGPHRTGSFGFSVIPPPSLDRELFPAAPT